MKKLLVIDDSEVNLYLVQSVFEDDPNIEVILESNSSQAMKTIREKKPDMVLLDLMMPNIDGFELLHEMRSVDEFKNLPVVVISAKTDDDSINQVKSYGVNEYIKKPVDLTEIEETIRKTLG